MRSFEVLSGEAGLISKSCRVTIRGRLDTPLTKVARSC